MNCLIFQDSQLQNPNTGATSIVSGICPPVQDWYTRNSFANSGVTLTWDPDKGRTNTRRRETCDAAHSCNRPQMALQTLIGDNTIAISCDEFPFAGSEEGGNFYTNQGRAASATCVPAWQNTLQGNCNSEYPNPMRDDEILTVVRNIEPITNQCQLLRTRCPCSCWY